MESRVQKTLENHKKGYNCAQAVACAYCDLVGMDEQSAFRATEAFGLGMGGMQATCGAVSGAVMLAGATVCKDLKGMETGHPLRSCDGCIEDAAELVEQILFSEE